MAQRLAIDFGTTNSVVAAWVDEVVRVLALPGLSDAGQADRPPLIPSLLFVDDGEREQTTAGQVVRATARDQQTGNRLFRNFKRGIAASPAPLPRLIDGAPWDDRTAGREFFRHLFTALPYPTAEIEQVVLTAPVASFEEYLTWLTDTLDAVAPDLPPVRLVDEATAAALGYAVTEPGAVVLVFDFGGGTLGLSLVQLPESREKTGGFLGMFGGSRAQASTHVARVIAKAGNTLGGSDVDQWLLAEVLARTGLTRAVLGEQYAALLTLCEDAKIALSSADETTIAFTVDEQAYAITLTRAEFEAILDQNQFYAALRHIIDKVMHTARQQGVFREDVDAVLLVGGSSLIPAVAVTLGDYFRHTPVLTHKPFTAVVEGALLIAAGYGLDDYLLHSYGLRYLDETTGEHAYDELIPAGARYPSDAPVEVVLSTAHTNQSEIEFVIGEISTDAVALVEVQYEAGQAVFVAQADASQQVIKPLNSDTPLIVTLGADSMPGEDRIAASFMVDDTRALRLTVTDLRTRKRLLRDKVVAILR